MTNTEIFIEFKRRADIKRDSLNIEEAPSREFGEAYLEGWRGAWMWAADILACITTEKSIEKRQDMCSVDWHCENLSEFDHVVLQEQNPYLLYEVGEI